MKRSLLLGCCLLWSIIGQLALAQTSPVTRVFGGGGYDEARAIIADTRNGGYLLVGHSTSYSTGNTDLRLVYMDSRGDVIWEKLYGDEGTEKAYDGVQTADGSFVLVGESDSYGAGEGINDLWAIKVDTNGKLVWSQTYGSTNSIDGGKSILATEDGGFLLAGKTFTIRPQAVPSQALLVKIDGQGKELWKKEYGGDKEDEFNDLIPREGGYLLVGSTESYGKGNWDMYIVAVDAEGNNVWNTALGGGDNEMGNAVTATSDGGYLLAGYTYTFTVSTSMDAWVVKIDAEGKQLWQQAYGSWSTDEAMGVVEVGEGQYIFAGYTEVYVPDEDNMNTSDEGHNVYLIKLNDKGETLWEKSLGGKQEQRAFSLALTKGGDLLLAGFTESVKRHTYTEKDSDGNPKEKIKELKTVDMLFMRLPNAGG